MTANEILQESKDRESERVKSRWRLIKSDLQALSDFGILHENMTLAQVMRVLSEGPTKKALGG